MSAVFLSWLCLSMIVWLTTLLVRGLTFRGLWSSLGFAGLFGLVNFGVGWLLFVVSGVPTLGVGLLVAFVARWFSTALLLHGVGALSSHLQVRSFNAVFFAAMVMSALSLSVDWVLTATFMM